MNFNSNSKVHALSGFYPSSFFFSILPTNYTGEQIKKRKDVQNISPDSALLVITDAKMKSLFSQSGQVLLLFLVFETIFEAPLPFGCPEGFAAALETPTCHNINNDNRNQSEEGPNANMPKKLLKIGLT